MRKASCLCGEVPASLLHAVDEPANDERRMQKMGVPGAGKFLLVAPSETIRLDSIDFEGRIDAIHLSATERDMLCTDYAVL